MKFDLLNQALSRGPVAARLKQIDRRPYKTRIDRSLTEAVNTITFDVGDDGEPLVGEGGRLKILVPAGCSAPTGSSALMQVRINDISAGYLTASGDNDVGFNVGTIRNVFGSLLADIVLVGGGAIASMAYRYSDGTTRSGGSNTFALLPSNNITAITKVYIALNNTYTFPVGTKIVYEEVAS